MVTTKQSPAPRKKAPVKSPTKAPALAAPAAGKPFIRFHHADKLRQSTESVLEAVEQADDPTAHRDAVAELVIELTNAGLDAYFMQPLKHAKAGFIVEQSAKLGMLGVQQLMGSVTRNIIGRMDPKQLLSVCGSIRGFMQ